MIELESRYELKDLVKSADLASSLAITDEDGFPEVLATARMVALMEMSAARLIRPLLTEGELSVGVNVDVKHLAATPVGEEVTAVSIYKGLEGKLHKFEVELHDRGGLVGKGLHTRAIVKLDRLQQGTASRLAG